MTDSAILKKKNNKITLYQYLKLKKIYFSCAVKLIALLVLTMPHNVYIQTAMRSCIVFYTGRQQSPYKAAVPLYCPVKSPPKWRKIDMHNK
ncbi:hypothetical protein XENOCAPTIV_003101 [Xenoophorus captivus]|uniref:Uncharacterized protein n=1 Tax=Xenoophorus captivus TaxID=1517983 RepID=A0ABV0S9V2_9TELE